MTKKNKYAAIFLIAVLIAGVGVFSWALNHSGARAGTNMSKNGSQFLAGSLAEKSADIRQVIIKMVIEGSIPENITFIGTKSSDDVFGSGKIDNISTPPEACSPPCSTWKYLPVSKKDKGWYVYGAGTSAADMIAYLPNIAPAVCTEIQKIFAYKSFVPPKQAGSPFDPSAPGVYAPQGGATTIKSQDNTLDGQEAGCFDNNVVGNGSSSFSYYGMLYGQ